MHHCTNTIQMQHTFSILSQMSVENVIKAILKNKYDENDLNKLFGVCQKKLDDILYAKKTHLLKQSVKKYKKYEELNKMIDSISVLEINNVESSTDVEYTFVFKMCDADTSVTWKCRDYSHSCWSFRIESDFCDFHESEYKFSTNEYNTHMFSDMWERFIVNKSVPFDIFVEFFKDLVKGASFDIRFVV